MKYENHPHKALINSLVDDFYKIEIFKQQARGNPIRISESIYQEIFSHFARLCAICRDVPIEELVAFEENFPKEAKIQARIEYIKNIFLVLRDEIGKIKRDENFEAAIKAESLKLGLGAYYEFTDEELGRAQELINDLRTVFSNSKVLQEDHRRRILGKLEKLQSELHKRVSDFDNYVGRLISLGQALGQFGEDAKPLFDRFKIVWRDAAQIMGRTDGGKQILTSEEVIKLPKPNDDIAA